MSAAQCTKAQLANVSGEQTLPGGPRAAGLPNLKSGDGGRGPVYTAIFFNLAISDAHWHGQPGEPEPRCHEFYYVTLATHTQSCDQDSILAAVNAAAAAVSESQASRGSVTGYHGSVTVPVCHTGDRSASTELASRGPCRSRRTVPDSAATRAAHGMVLAVLWLAISKS